MPDEKKKYNALTDLGAPLRGLTNVVSGRIFDAESWNDEKDVARALAPQKVTKQDEDDEVIEESSSRTVRRGKRGTFTAAPAETKRAAKRDDAVDDDADPKGKGKTPGVEDKKEG